MSNASKPAAPRIIGTKPGQYQGRSCELVTADGQRIAGDFANASAQGAAIRNLRAQGVEVVAIDFTSDRYAAMYAAAAAKLAAR